MNLLSILLLPVILLLIHLAIERLRRALARSRADAIIAGTRHVGPDKVGRCIRTLRRTNSRLLGTSEQDGRRVRLLTDVYHRLLGDGIVTRRS